MAWRRWLTLATSAATVRITLATAAVVGPTLIAIDQGERILAGQGIEVIKAVLTVAVLYLVATYGAVAAQRRQERNRPGARFWCKNRARWDHLAGKFCPIFREIERNSY